MDMNEVVEALGNRDVPVLACTVATLRKMRREEDRVTARDISRVVLRDPLMTLKALRFAEANRSIRQLSDITTVEHVVMMHGIGEFLRTFADLTSLEGLLAKDSIALDGALRVVSRAQHAAAFARSIASRRHDKESDEVIIAALLHDLAELMLWLHAPREVAEIRYLVDHAVGLRSAAAQRFVLGFTHGQLQHALAGAWHLPRLLQRLMDDEHAENPRVVNVVLATRLARHLAHGWYDAALPDDYSDLEHLLGCSEDGARRMVRAASLNAARLWADTGIRPVAAGIPLEEGDIPPEPGLFLPSGNVDGPLFKSALQKLTDAAPRRDHDPFIAWALYALQFGLGLKRVGFAASDANGEHLQMRFVFDLDAPVSPWRDMPMPLGGTDLFSRLSGNMQGVWAGGDNRERVASLLLPEQGARIGRSDFLAMSVRGNDGAGGLVIADRGSAGGAIPDRLYAPFKALCVKLAEKLDTPSY
jgi:HD-like signal output (HDOD) protein